MTTAITKSLPLTIKFTILLWISPFSNSETARFSRRSRISSAYLLISGKMTFEWENESVCVDRPNCFDYDPWVLHVANGVKVTFKAHGDVEIVIQRTINERTFPSKLYTPEECRSENRGAGTMREASTRIVRTVFDYSNAPYSNMVLGEVIGYPGKWSSYPPLASPARNIFLQVQPRKRLRLCRAR